MKAYLAVAPFLLLVFQSCSIRDYRQSKGDLARIKKLVKEGDNIREARALLAENDFSPTEVKKRTVTQNTYSFTVRLSEPTELDYLGYAMDVNLTPWRNGVKSWVAFNAGLDEVIDSIYYR